MILTGDCLDLMPTLPAESIDAIVTDPPYGLEFMGKEWDRFAPERTQYHGERADTTKSIGADDSKPSSRHHVAYNMGRPTFRRCRECGKREFSGSPCRCDCPIWDYEQPEGTPTRMSAFQKWSEAWARELLRVAKPGAHLLAFGGTRTYHRLACAIEDAGWEVRDCLVWAYASGFPKSLNLDGDRKGWGTALKPAWEPIILARKPLRGTVAANVTEYGTGALNIDGCRIGTTKDTPASPRRAPQNAAYGELGNDPGTGGGWDANLGRWPANLILTDPIFDGDAPGVVGGGDSGPMPGTYRHADGEWNLTSYAGTPPGAMHNGYGDSGTYSRFFLVPKASRADREPKASRIFGSGLSAETKAANPTMRANHHPTVKPTELMRHLVRLVTPPGGTVLDPFLGSGTTAVACEMEGFDWIGIERESEYVAIAEARLSLVQRGLGLA